MKFRRKALVVIPGLILLAGASALAQSGRRLKVVPPPPPPPVAEPADTKTQNQDEVPPVTAQKSEVYACSDDKTLTRVLDPDANKEQTFTMKQVDTSAKILKRPPPSYTREARSAGVQGYVILRVVLSSNGKIGQIRVLRGLPAGLTESGIRAACKIQFEPALKDGKTVSQSVQVEYSFRLY